LSLDKWKAERTKAMFVETQSQEICVRGKNFSASSKVTFKEYVHIKVVSLHQSHSFDMSN